MSLFSPKQIHNRFTCVNTLPRGSLFVNLWSVGGPGQGGIPERVPVRDVVTRLERAVVLARGIRLSVLTSPKSTSWAITSICMPVIKCLVCFL